MYRIGIDLGGTFVKAGLVDENGRIVVKSKIPTKIERPYVEVFEDMANQARKLCEDAGITLADVEKVGVGCPGAITSKTGVVSYSANFNWTDVPIADGLSALLGMPVKVSNDANVAALGEAIYGAARNYGDSIMFTLGTGVGGGIIIDKKIYEGNESKGAEIGHSVIVVGGEPCNCGRRGCLEAYCSATALIRETKRAMLEDKSSLMWERVKGDINAVDGETSFACEKLGDKAAKKVVDQYVFYLAESIMNFCNIFRPEAIVLGGGVCAQGDNLVGRIVELCERGYYGYKGTPKVAILIAELKNAAGILGAAAL